MGSRKRNNSSPSPLPNKLPGVFTLHLHHGGQLLWEHETLKYVGGKVHTINECDPDKWSLQEINFTLKDLGYKGNVKLFYNKPGFQLQFGLFEVKSDKEAMKIAEVGMGICSKHVSVYTIHGCSPSDGIQLTTYEEEYDAVHDGSDYSGDSSDHSVEGIQFSDSEDEEDDDCFLPYFNDVPIPEQVAEAEPVVQPEPVAQPKEVAEPKPISQIEPTPQTEPMFQHEENDESFQQYLNEIPTLTELEEVAQPRVVADQDEISQQVELMPAIVLEPHEEITSDYDSDKLMSDNGSSDEDQFGNPKKQRYMQYNPNEMCANFKFQLGMEFTSINQFKDAIREWSLLNGWGLRFKKNDAIRCRVVCREGCEWLAFVSKVGGSMTYRLKTLRDKHTCGKTYKSKMASGKWVAEKLAKTMETNKGITLSGVIQNIRNDYFAEVSVHKAYWARRMAKEKIEGSYKEQYSKLWDYCEEIRRALPRSTIGIETENPTGGPNPRFFRMYMCLKPVKEGFLTSCRPIVGLDGCFLKSPYGGILLVAVAKDPNDQYFPLACVAVERENKASWIWFLTKLLDDIGYDKRWVFISDQQKGLVPAIESLFEHVEHCTIEHRTCVRHLYANMKKRYGGGTVLRDRMLAACKATYHADWVRKMANLKAVSKVAHDWLMETDPKLWAKSHFSFYPKCDLIMNNISEAFNGRILEARDQPVISMFEWIRSYLMTRFAKNRLLAEKYKGKGKICPKPRKRLDKQVAESGKWTAIWSGMLKYEVRKYSEHFQVDLEAKICACGFWELTGLPCQHAGAAIFANNEDPQDYAHEYYHINKYATCYAPVITPINGENLWPVTGLPAVLPPAHRTPIGRPKKVRRREKDEPPKKYKLKRCNTSLRCGRCNSYGHNKTNCQNMVQPVEIATLTSFPNLIESGTATLTTLVEEVGKTKGRRKKSKKGGSTPTPKPASNEPVVGAGSAPACAELAVAVGSARGVGDLSSAGGTFNASASMATVTYEAVYGRGKNGANTREGGKVERPKLMTRRKGQSSVMQNNDGVQMTQESAATKSGPN